MDNSSCWCYLCSQRVIPVVESDALTVRTISWNGWVAGARASWIVSRFGLPVYWALVSGGFSALDEEVGWRREGMLFGLAEFSFGGDCSDVVADFALSLSDYLLEGETGVRRDCPRRLKLNRVRVCERGEQCCICSEDFELGEEAEEMPCKHRFHGCCISSWLKKGNGTCPICRCRISDSGEGETERFAFAYSRERNSLRYGARRVLTRIQGIGNHLGRWSPA